MSPIQEKYNGFPHPAGGRGPGPRSFWDGLCPVSYTHLFVNVDENGERTFSFARKPGADTQFREQEVKLDILDHTTLFHVGSLSVSDQPSRDTTFFALKRAKGCLLYTSRCV